MIKKGLLGKCTLTIGLSLFLQANTFAATAQHATKLIIIGAGTAGLRAGEYLESKGFKDFIILEARKHIGGRTYTYYSKDPAWQHIGVDLGANWVHGAGPYNPLTRLVEKTIPIPYKLSESENAAIYNSNNRLLSAKEKEAVNALFRKFKSYIEARQADVGPDKSVWEVLQQYLKNQQLSPEQKADLVYMVSSAIEKEYAADSNELSAKHFNDDESFRGPEWLITGGYSRLAQYMARNLQSHIRMNQAVASIDYSVKGQVIVTTQDGTVYHCKTVISTLPAGVMKKGKVKFIPSLPPAKQEALSHMNMGVLNKIWLKFPQQFWKNSSEFIERIPRAHLAKGEWVNMGPVIEFGNMGYYLGKPVLLALVSGDYAVNMEKKTDGQIIHDIMSSLRKIYGSSIPEPSAHKITRWRHDQWAYGSYSSLRPGAIGHGGDSKALSRPIGDRLLFAGEATHPYYSSTVHGAYLSGEREAKRFLHENPGTVRDLNNSISGFTYFRSSDLTTWGKGNYGLDIAPDIDHFRDSRAVNLPISLSYGVIDSLDIGAALTSYEWIHPVGERQTSGLGDLLLEAKYVAFNFANSMNDVGMNFDLTLPTGNFRHGLSDGLVHYAPSVMAAHTFFFEDWAAQAMAQVGFDATSRARSYAYYADNEPQLTDFTLHLATGALNDYFVMTAEYDLISSRYWSNNGNSTSFVTPGIKFFVGKQYLVGVGVPIGVGRSTGDYQVKLTFTRAFNNSIE